uniref:Uncharacterized protein n=1 Tax=Plectus sambesii TaxID=2011161 RepID=A0A914UNL1_9BILA
MDMLPVYSENDPKYKCFPCVCINYKIGALIVAGVELVKALVFCVAVVVYVNFYGQQEMQHSTSADLKTTEIVLTILVIVILFQSVLVAICLLFGVIRQNVFLLTPYMIKTGVVILVVVSDALMSGNRDFLVILLWESYSVYIVYRCRSMFLDKKASWQRCEQEARITLATQDFRLAELEPDEDERNHEVHIPQQET